MTITKLLAVSARRRQPWPERRIDSLRNPHGLRGLVRALPARLRASVAASMRPWQAEVTTSIGAARLEHLARFRRPARHEGTAVACSMTTALGEHDECGDLVRLQSMAVVERLGSFCPGRQLSSARATCDDLLLDDRRIGESVNEVLFSVSHFSFPFFCTSRRRSASRASNDCRLPAVSNDIKASQLRACFRRAQILADYRQSEFFMLTRFSPGRNSISRPSHCPAPTLCSGCRGEGTEDLKMRVSSLVLMGSRQSCSSPPSLILWTRRTRFSRDQICRRHEVDWPPPGAPRTCA